MSAPPRTDPAADKGRGACALDGDCQERRARTAAARRADAPPHTPRRRKTGLHGASKNAAERGKEAGPKTRLDLATRSHRGAWRAAAGARCCACVVFFFLRPGLGTHRFCHNFSRHDFFSPRVIGPVASGGAEPKRQRRRRRLRRRRRPGGRPCAARTAGPACTRRAPRGPRSCP